MQKTTVFTLISFIIVAGVVLSGVFWETLTSEQQQPAVVSQNQNTAALEVQAKLDKLTSALAQYQQYNQEQLRQALQQQDRLNEMVAALDARFQSLGAVTDERDDGHIADDAAAHSAIQSQATRTISEADLGQWIEESFDVYGVDTETAEHATYEITESLNNLPDVYLDDIRCGQGICRATFSHTNGERPEVFDLIGRPPFTNEVSTIDGDDGRVLVYFTEVGMSLEDFRAEALKMAELGLN